MAEVLPPLTQSSSTITMLNPRPSSSDAFQGSQTQYQQPSRLGQTPRSMYNGQNAGYRGASSPIQPYAFQATPHLRQDSRASVASAPSPGQLGTPRHGHTPSGSASTTSSSDVSSQPSAKDDSVLGASNATPSLNLSLHLPDLSLHSFDQPAKSSPDRYRRPAQKRGDSNISATSKAPSQQPDLTTDLDTPRQRSVDDTALPRSGQPELAKRYRRRSLNQLETTSLVTTPTSQAALAASRPPSSQADPSATSTPTTIRPTSLHHDAKALNDDVLSLSPANAAEQGKDAPRMASTNVEQRGINVPARGSSEPAKRHVGPSPLSRQANGPDSGAVPAPAATRPKTYAAAAQSAMQPPSAAAAQLAAVSDRDLNKGMKSRLRRAFSFGSAQELRRAAGENNQAAAAPAASQQAQQAITHQQQQQQQQQSAEDEMDAEQLEIARRQEEAGIGAGIYSGQGGFSGSTDNLSISSTASSASMMLRKMGRGAKKGARSIKGLFRPKSVIGVPAADGPIQVMSAAAPVQASVAEVSMVTVEAERHNVNVNAHPEELVGGGTGFPKLERNSLDAATMGLDAPPSIDGSDSHSRRSIVGSDKDRAEVLAAVKKGILKRSGTASSSGSPSIITPDSVSLQVVESPVAPMPGTPRDAAKGRSVSAVQAKGDYFANKAPAGAKSMPNTPNGSLRNISFSPRIQFHDVWSSTEYDRRGEIATCNRLTPMLAQQIKEELNTFKMEMEVHELSKPHTHFF